MLSCRARSGSEDKPFLAQPASSERYKLPGNLGEVLRGRSRRVRVSGQERHGPPRKTVFLGEPPLRQKIVLAPGSSRSVTRSRREARTCRWVRGSGAAADLRRPPLRHGLKARALGPLSRNIQENLAAPLVRSEHPGRRRSPPSPGDNGGRVRPASRSPVPRRTASPSFDASLTLTPVRGSSQPR